MNDWVMGILIGSLVLMIFAFVIPFMLNMLWEAIQMLYDWLKYR